MLEYFVYLNLVAICYPLTAFVGLALIFHQLDHSRPLWRGLIGPVWYMAALVFYLVDVVLNHTLVVLYMLELPGYWGEPVTVRFKCYLKRYHLRRRGPLEKWRYGFALFICRVLNAADSGHCGRLPR